MTGDCHVRFCESRGAKSPPATHQGMRRTATATALLCLFLAVPCAQGAYDPLGGGTTKLLLAKRFVSFLKRDGVKLTATAPAKRKGNSLTLPLAGGSIDPTIGKGEVDSEGALLFQSAKGRVPLRKLTIKTKHSPLIAKVGGSQLKVATSSKLSSKREGFGTELSARQLKLSAKVATRLNKKLRPKVPFKAGQPLGSLLSEARPQLVTVLATGKTTLALDPAFVAKLDQRFVSLNPIFPAEHSGPSFTFPIISGGQIAPDASTGTLRSGGELELLQLGGGQLFWHELWLDLGARVDSAEANAQPSPPYPGKEGRVGVLDLGAASVLSDPGARTIAVSGAPLTLQAATATALNQLFAEGRDVFRAGEALGGLSFVAVGQ